MGGRRLADTGHGGRLGRGGPPRADGRLDASLAGVNIDVAYTIFTGVRLVILTEDVDKARAALDLSGAGV